jgi:hypothetical protein
MIAIAPKTNNLVSDFLDKSLVIRGAAALIDSGIWLDIDCRGNCFVKINGTSYQIRTGDLHFEGVASWAARRRRQEWRSHRELNPILHLDRMA